MPAKKPISLSNRHNTRAETADRKAAESSVTPKTKIIATVPITLRGKIHSAAAAEWKRKVKLYLSVDAQLLTLFDVNILERYCKMYQECLEQEELARNVMADYEAMRKKAKNSKSEETMKLWNTVNDLGKRLQSIDARLDGKRKELHKLEMSLYLTPRSRAGVAPPEKEKEDTSDPMAELLKEGP